MIQIDQNLFLKGLNKINLTPLTNILDFWTHLQIFYYFA